MNPHINFNNELLRNKFWKNQYHHYILENLFGHTNLINKIPPIQKYNVTELHNQNLQIPSALENERKGMPLSTEISNPKVVKCKVLYNDDSFVLSKIPEKKEKETVIELSSEEASHTWESAEINFSNPVNYQKKERFSKKYDKGNFLLNSSYL